MTMILKQHTATRTWQLANANVCLRGSDSIALEPGFNYDPIRLAFLSGDPTDV